MPKRILRGVVINAAADKTISVSVERAVMHKKYRKTVRLSKKYAVHDESNKYKIGDVVDIIESAPISKTKKWVVSQRVVTWKRWRYCNDTNEN